MIAIATREGELLKALPENTTGTFGFHPRFGIIGEKACQERLANRKRHGLHTSGDQWVCRFGIADTAGSRFQVQSIEGCRVSGGADGTWTVQSALGDFVISNKADLNPLRVAPPTVESEFGLGRSLAVVAVFLLLATSLLMIPPKTEEAEKEVPEPTTVVIHPVDAVKVPQFTSPHAELAQKPKTDGGKGGYRQDLGFLGIVGEKDLKQAIGGVPTHLENVTAGAGKGSDKGTGGEMLVGLGQGVKRTTVGNTGVAGLGGVGGGKGEGGGAGGYGGSLVASGSGAGSGRGDGKGLSSLALGDDMELDGGLDANVIKATIAKYLNQVRACYELGLRRNPGLTGQVTMNFEVGGQGMLNFAKVLQSTLGDAEVSNCISDRMMTWQFPRPVGGVNVKVKYPFLLRPVNS